MRNIFFDTKLRRKVEAKVSDAVTFEGKKNTRYALKATTRDNRTLFVFCNKKDYKKFHNITE